MTKDIYDQRISINDGDIILYTNAYNNNDLTSGLLTQMTGWDIKPPTLRNTQTPLYGSAVFVSPRVKYQWKPVSFTGQFVLNTQIDLNTLKQTIQSVSAQTGYIDLNMRYYKNGAEYFREYAKSIPSISDDFLTDWQPKETSVEFTLNFSVEPYKLTYKNGSTIPDKANGSI